MKIELTPGEFVLEQRLRDLADREIKAGGAAWMRWPDRWHEPIHGRCVNGHVSRCFLKSEATGFSLCLSCYRPTFLTFPEDSDGPLPEYLDCPWCSSGSHAGYQMRPCPRCHADNLTSENHCNIPGKITCPTCGGEQTHKCPSCRNGWLDDECTDPCLTCTDGNGASLDGRCDPGEVLCGNCGGEGRVDCPACSNGFRTFKPDICGLCTGSGTIRIITLSELEALLSKVHNLLGQRDYNTCNDLLGAMLEAMLSDNPNPTEAIGVLRAALPVRTQLPNWTKLLESTRSHIVTVGGDTALLRGLHSHEPRVSNASAGLERNAATGWRRARKAP